MNHFAKKTLMNDKVDLPDLKRLNSVEVVRSWISNSTMAVARFIGQYLWSCGWYGIGQPLFVICDKAT